LVAPDQEARAYFKAQGAEARRLGFPTMAAFAKSIARGTVSLAPTPDDPQLEFVGRFMWRLPHKAVKLRIKVRQFYAIRDKVLWSLRGYLMASGDSNDRSKDSFRQNHSGNSGGYVLEEW
jgi:hypothetical protein